MIQCLCLLYYFLIFLFTILFSDFSCLLICAYIILYMCACLCARHLASFYAFIGLFFDTPGPACLDSRVRSESVIDPSVEY